MPFGGGFLSQLGGDPAPNLPTMSSDPRGFGQRIGNTLMQPGVMNMIRQRQQRSPFDPMNAQDVVGATQRYLGQQPPQARPDEQFKQPGGGYLLPPGYGPQPPPFQLPPGHRPHPGDVGSEGPGYSIGPDGKMYHYGQPVEDQQKQWQDFIGGNRQPRPGPYEAPEPGDPYGSAGPPMPPWLGYEDPNQIHNMGPDWIPGSPTYRGPGGPGPQLPSQGPRFPIGNRGMPGPQANFGGPTESMYARFAGGYRPRGF